MEDIRRFKKDNGLARMVMVWCASTEVFLQPPPTCTRRWRRSRRGCEATIPNIAPSMVYAYAAIKLGIPYANGAPNLSADMPALLELARERRARRSAARTSRPARP